MKLEEEDREWKAKREETAKRTYRLSLAAWLVAWERCGVGACVAACLWPVCGARYAMAAACVGQMAYADAMCHRATVVEVPWCVCAGAGAI